jgi:hypothetical protein
MYKIVYHPILGQPQVEIKEFDSYKNAMYFANKFQSDGYVLEIKWYPNQT